MFGHRIINLKSIIKRNILFSSKRPKHTITRHTLMLHNPEENEVRAASEKWRAQQQT